MTRATTVRAVLAAVVLLVSLFVTLTMSPRLGLDLQGGTRLVLQAKDSPTAKADRESTDRTVEVLRQRIDALGVAEPTVTRSGEDRVLVELPDVTDPREAAEVLGRTAQLTFHPVLGVPDDAAPDPKPESKPKSGSESESAELVLPDESGARSGSGHRICRARGSRTHARSSTGSGERAGPSPSTSATTRPATGRASPEKPPAIRPRTNAGGSRSCWTRR